jgi:O-acetyl-ADP-ribose deacetylase (regulator of RNase III)
VSETPESLPLYEDGLKAADIVADLRVLRERGLVRIRHTELAVLRLAASRCPACSPGEVGPRAIETLLRLAVDNLGGGELAAAAAHTFGLNQGWRERPAQDRRRHAAQQYGVSIERFRKHHERLVIEQVAEEILELCQQAPARPLPDRQAHEQSAGEPVALQAELATESRLDGHVGDVRCPVVVHIEPVELLRGVDVVVAPSNIYFEVPPAYKVSVSASLRRAAAMRDRDGAIAADPVADELREWIRAHGRSGVPVTAGTVAATSAGRLARQGIRRIYHAAIATPRPGTNDYYVDPAAIAQAVHQVFALARYEGDLFQTPLSSLGFPLLGAGRGGIAPETSFSWLWAAIRREISVDEAWTIHFVTRRRATADVVLVGLTASGYSSAL